MAIKKWVKLPTKWIENGGLKHFKWEKEGGSSRTAALMLLMVIAHHSDEDTGITYLNYDDLTFYTHLSRTKVADGLEVLVSLNIVKRNIEGRSTYKLVDYDPSTGWGKLPAKGLYTPNGIRAFEDFHLRKRGELDALKAYFAFIARRDRNFNRAHMTYKQIEDYAGIPQARIKTAISILAANSLVVIDQTPSLESDYGVSNAYRLVHLEPNVHQGTRGRASL